MNIFIDIETVPCQILGIRAELSEEIKHPGVLKKAESIAEWEREVKPAVIEEAWRKTSFDGGLGQIVCIGWAVDDEEVRSLQVADLTRNSEWMLLIEWFTELRNLHAGMSGRVPTLIGHNHVAFDLPFIWKRAMIQAVKPPFWFHRDIKPWSDSIFDTMTEWSGVRDRISMDRLCRILGIPGKADGPTGADVWPMVLAGKIDDVAEYCRSDVWRTREIFKRMTFKE